MHHVLAALTGLLHSPPCSAFCAGAGVYLGWIALFALGLRQPASGGSSSLSEPCTEGSAQPHSSQRQHTSQRRKSLARYAATATLVGIVFATMAMALGPDDEDRCAAISFLRTEVDADENATCAMSGCAGAEENATELLRPSELLTRARVALKFRSGRGPLQSSLEACAAWTPVSAPWSADDESDFHAQLLCLRGLVESALVEGQKAPSAFARSTHLVEAARAHGSRQLARGLQVEAGRVAGATLRQGCAQLGPRLTALRKAAASRTELLDALADLAALELPLQAAAAAGQQAGSARALPVMSLPGIEAGMTAGPASHCLLGALREAQGLLTQGAQPAPECAGRLLERLGDLTVRLAHEERREGQPATSLGLGLHYSDLALASQGASAGTWSSGWNWVRDAEGWHVPQPMASAEELLLEGEELLPVGPERSEKAAVRALRLYQHAKFLALKHHDAAAEWRFKAAAKLAAANRRQKLAAHSLARLSYFLMLRGKHQESLELAGAALGHASDPFAEYIQVTLRRNLGDLRTEADLELFEQRLAAAAGRLPSPLLEEQRAATHAEMRLWRDAAKGGIAKCFHMQDAAKVLMCLICKVALA